MSVESPLDKDQNNQINIDVNAVEEPTLDPRSINAEHLEDEVVQDSKATLRSQIGWAVVSGVLLGLSQPLVIGFFGPAPIDSTGLSGLLVFVGMVPLYLVIREAGPKKAYWLGVVAMGVKYTIVLYWLVIAMHVFGGIPMVFSRA